MFDLQYNLDLSSRSRWNIVNATATAKAGLIYAQEIGDFYAGAHYFTRRRDFPSFLLKMAIDGCGILEYGNQRYRVPAGHFFWIDCANEQHYYTDPDAGSWHVMWVHFYGANARSYYDAFISGNQGSPVAPFPMGLPVFDIFTELLELNPTGGNQLLNDFRASGLLTRLLSQCVCAAMSARQASDVPQIVQSARLYLQNHYREKNTLQQLGSRFNINPCYLQKQFRRYVGQSPTEYQISLRIGRAKELIRSSSRPIGEIAYAVGIENLGYFTRLFKQQEGMTPQEYRKLWPVLEHAWIQTEQQG